MNECCVMQKIFDYYTVFQGTLESLFFASNHKAWEIKAQHKTDNEKNPSIFIIMK